MTTIGAHRSTAANRFACALIAAMIALAGVHAWRVTSALTWPYDPDLFRDIAAAETMLGGDLLSDPLYRDESIWYNPLVPALVAATSVTTGIGVPKLYARAGVVFNVLVPVMFAALAWLFGGPWAAVAATALFVFGPVPSSRPWAWPSYSAWLFPTVFAQALFYATLMVLHRAYNSESLPAYLTVGCLLGLTFLAHTAPALIIGGIMVLGTLGILRRGFNSKARLTGTFLALAAAAAISLPLTISIVGRYQLRVLNSAPASWESGEMLLASFPTLVSGVLSIPGILALAGVAVILFDPLSKQVRRVLVGWLIVNAGWLMWIYVCQLVRKYGWSLGTIVPDYHFLFYWRALAAVLGGIGAFGIARLCARVVPLAHLPAALVIVALAGVMPFAYPRFTSRFEFTNAVSAAAARNEQHPDVVASKWIRWETPRDAVFLSYDDVALYVVGPTGRKVVGVGAFFSNPYVDREIRIDARRFMWMALRAGDQAAFCRTADSFKVTHVILGEEHSGEWAAKMRPFVEPAFSAGPLRIWRVYGCQPGRG